MCGDAGREGDVGNDDSSESIDDGEGSCDGFEVTFNMIGDVPDIRMCKPLLPH